MLWWCGESRNWAGKGAAVLLDDRGRLASVRGKLDFRRDGTSAGAAPWAENATG